MVSVTTDDTPLQLNELRLGVGACWPFLLDADRGIARDLDILEYADVEHNPMIPHTIVLEPGLKIYKIYDGDWFWSRPSCAKPGNAKIARGSIRTALEYNQPHS